MSKNFKPGDIVAYINADGYLPYKSEHVVDFVKSEPCGCVSVYLSDLNYEEYCGDGYNWHCGSCGEKINERFCRPSVLVSDLVHVGISLTMHRAELSELKSKEVMERTIELNLLQKQ